MFGVLLIHAAYAVLMYAFSFRIMVIPHAIQAFQQSLQKLV